MPTRHFLIRIALSITLIWAVNVRHHVALADEPVPAAAPEASDEPVGDATAIEYGLIAALVAVVIIGALTPLGSSLQGTFKSAAEEIPTAKLLASALDTKTFSAIHTPGGVTATDDMYSAEASDGRETTMGMTADTDFANNTFELGFQNRVLNSVLAGAAPDFGSCFDLEYTTTVEAEDPNGKAGTSDLALLRLEIQFTQLLWGINGPVYGQDGYFELEGPGGTVYSFEILHDPQNGMQLLAVSGYDPVGFAIGQGQGPVTIQGLTYWPNEILSGVPPAVFEFEIPYNVPTDVTFTLRQVSHQPVFANLSDVPELSTASTLSQNVPNPFNPQTEIVFTLAEPGHAEIVLFDVQGHELRKLGGREFGPGSHRLTWDGKDHVGRSLASGIYSYLLNVDGKVVESRKTVLAR